MACMSGLTTKGDEMLSVRCGGCGHPIRHHNKQHKPVGNGNAVLARYAKIKKRKFAKGVRLGRGAWRLQATTAV